MTTPLASSWIEVADLTGPQGEPGPTGTSITGAEVNGSGDLIITLSTGGSVNAGHVVGAAGGGIDFESSVATVGDLPASAPYGEARYVQANGHLYVFEADGGGAGVDGWTDVGPIKGETGSTGPAGADGVSVTGASINGSGHLIITLSAGGPIDAGVAKGADGATGAAGADGADGLSPITYTAGSVPAASSYHVGQIAFGSDGKMLRAV